MCKRRTSTENTPRKMSFGDGGLGDHSAKYWEWPLGERQQVEVHGNERTFEAWLDFRPYQPNEIWAKVMCDELIIQCKGADCSRELVRKYTLPLNCDARTAKFRIKDKHILVITVDKTLPIKLAVANYSQNGSRKNSVDENDNNRQIMIHAEIGRRRSGSTDRQ